MNVMDYLDWRGDITFQERGLNEVDNVIFSILAYLKLDGYIDGSGSQILTLMDLKTIFSKNGYAVANNVCDPAMLFEKAAETKRFRDVKAGFYSSLYDSEKQVQFAAVTFSYDDGRSCIAFRGTDNTLAGWREDFNFSYQTATPGQTAAADYINHVANRTGNRFVVSGHSKGGNFAVYGAAFCDAQIRSSLIDRVYSNDGPGFNSVIAESDNYNAVLGITEKLIPESSIIGILLSSKARRKVVKSSAKGKNQHNPYSWNVIGTQFEPADARSISSILVDSAFSSWISSLDEQEKALIINSLFDALESTGLETFRDLKAQKSQTALALIKGAMKLKPERRKQLADSFTKFFSSGKTRITQELKKAVIDLQLK